MPFTPEQETILAKVARKEKAKKELKALKAERDALYLAKENELKAELLKTENAVNSKHMPIIDAKDLEIKTKEDEINAAD